MGRGDGERHEAVPALLASYDVLCCVSTGFENGPTVAIESLAVGTPLVVSRVGNLPELVDDGRNGRLVAPGDARELAKVLTDLALEPGQIDRWRTQLPSARTMDDVAADYEAMYAALVRQGTGVRPIVQARAPIPARASSPELRVAGPESRAPNPEPRA